MKTKLQEFQEVVKGLKGASNIEIYLEGYWHGYEAYIANRLKCVPSKDEEPKSYCCNKPIKDDGTCECGKRCFER